LAAGRRPRVPVLVGELIGGILLGRTGLNLIDPTTQPFPVFASLGFAMLLLESGAEIDLGSKLVRETASASGWGRPTGRSLSSSSPEAPPPWRYPPSANRG
jgi:Kef-type K+ transport system membrane component KefB